MRKIIIFIGIAIAIIVFCSICNASEYKQDIPNKTQTILHEWSFGIAELKDLIIEKLRKDGVIFPEGELEIKFNTKRDGSFYGITAGVTLSIKESVKIIIVP